MEKLRVSFATGIVHFKDLDLTLNVQMDGQRPNVPEIAWLYREFIAQDILIIGADNVPQINENEPQFYATPGLELWFQASEDLSKNMNLLSLKSDNK
jgi:hypothetical protein